MVLLSLFGSQPATLAQQQTYIGFVYPAGGQQGTTFQVRLGGQGLDGVHAVLVSGQGATAKLSEYYRRLNNQELQLLNEQVRVLNRELMAQSEPDAKHESNSAILNTPEPAPATNQESASAAARKLIDRIEKRTSEYVQNPACPSIASLAIVEVTIAPDAEPGAREIRLVTPRGVSNPLPFYVGQVPEFSRPPMLTASKQILGKEAEALRRRLPSQLEERVSLPCTLNGQIASGEVNRYRFQAAKGQRLVITTLGRQLVPFIADAVPGWFQPVLILFDAAGNELAYDDDYWFKPDPTILYHVPEDGEYVLEIHDSLYRGREDFVYRITIGELPFITSIFPLGGPSTGSSPASNPSPHFEGWNLEGAEPVPVSATARAGICSLGLSRKGVASNRVPFATSPFPEVLEQEPNNSLAAAQSVHLPVIVNGRIDRKDDADVFQFEAKSNDVIVAEVIARRLDSPLDSFIKLTDSTGNVLAFNDDHEDLASGLNTHQADSWLMLTLPADGHYYLHLTDTARHGGPAYGYRLRISAPQPDFDLRVVPSSVTLRRRSSAAVTVYTQRKDGFNGPIRVTLKDPPPGFSAAPCLLAATQTVARLNLRADASAAPEPVPLSFIGTATVDEHELVRQAVPAEDRMQAFLWRHLVPARQFFALAPGPGFQQPARRMARLSRRPPATPAVTNAPGLTTNSVTITNSPTGTNPAPAVAEKSKFTRQQVLARLRQLRFLFDEGLLTDEFYAEKVAECEAGE